MGEGSKDVSPSGNCQTECLMQRTSGKVSQRLLSLRHTGKIFLTAGCPQPVLLLHTDGISERKLLPVYTHSRNQAAILRMKHKNQKEEAT